MSWQRASLFLGVVAVLSAATAVALSRGDPALAAERMKPPLQRDQPPADKILVVCFLLSFCAWVLFIAHDASHLRLLGTPGSAVSFFGFLLFVGGWWVVYAALRENRFAAPVVKLQRERRHVVVDSGCYGVVRHPMYAGAVPLLVGMPLWLGSYAAALLAAVPIAILAVRIVFEERFLRRSLAGYGEYTHKVRYRLLPFVW